MRRLLLAAALSALTATAARAEGTIHILMETVPDTRYIQDLLPEFKAAQARLDELMETVQQTGAELKGFAPLLVDFPSEMDGVPVLVLLPFMRRYLIKGLSLGALK